MANTSFRYDINALRAIAVIAVIIFHYAPHILPGGFAGVDIFFVISGYLMTSIVYKGLLYKNFSFYEFYKARARRIIPALALLCVAVLIFGYLFVIPKDYLILSEHTTASLLFFSNFTYFLESGYFDAASHEKWLLHLVSLC